MFSSSVSFLPVVNKDGQGHRDHNKDTERDDDGGEIVYDDLGVREDGGDVRQTTAVAAVQDVLAHSVSVVDVAGQLAAIHYLGLVSRNPGSDKRGF